MTSSFVILPYVNNPEQTLQATQDVLAQTLPVTPLLICNGGTLLDQEVRASLDTVYHWHYSPALPLAAVWNQALQFVWASGGEYALVCNNDLRLPYGLYADLLQAMALTDAWFVTAVNVGTAWHDGMLRQRTLVDQHLCAARGGPDFSCFLITKECHDQFKFDEGFSPAYGEDCSYHRTLMLAGHGPKIFSVCVPYLHYASGTLNAMPPEARARKEQQIEGSRRHYQRIWGGMPNSETFIRPGGPEEYTGVTNPDLQRWVEAGKDVKDLLDGVLRG
jgi:hypothetical protein